jgi:hypothetical protein
LSRAEPPQPKAAQWARTLPDLWILEALERAGLAPSPEADRVAWLRRVHFDLTGLPPSPEAAQSFQKDSRSDAYERVVEALLQSPAYGERWGQHWLDVVRYADTHGFEVNTERPHAWPYRDYVIRAFNTDTPYAQFIREQLTGDQLGCDAATGFLVTASVLLPGQIGADDISKRLARQDALDEIVVNTAQSFLGLSIGCARCHDHKFDPISSRDYFGMQAFFAGVEYGDRDLTDPESQARREDIRRWKERKGVVEAALAGLDAQSRPSAQSLQDERLRLEHAIAGTVASQQAFAGIFRKPDRIHLLRRGDPEQPGPEVTPAVPAVLGTVRLPAETPEPQRRQALADWLSRPDQALITRVLVNRIWQGHFGTGLVDTPNDFGQSGSRPSHPGLLDGLAREFIANGGSIKHLHRVIVLSSTYRQSSSHRREAAALDAEARLLWRYPPRRLDSEPIRDALLTVSGELNRQRAGRGFDLFDQRGGLSGFKPVESFPAEGLRRMIYAHKVRREPEAVFGAFDCPDAGQSTARRRESTTPIQALNLWNSRFMLERSTAFARRVRHEAGAEPRQQIQRAFWLALCRPASRTEELEAWEAVRGHGLEALCRALLNSNEFLYIP